MGVFAVYRYCIYGTYYMPVHTSTVLILHVPPCVYRYIETRLGGSLCVCPHAHVRVETPHNASKPHMYIVHVCTTQWAERTCTIR